MGAAPRLNGREARGRVTPTIRFDPKRRMSRVERARYLVEEFERAAIDFIQKHKVSHDEFRVATTLLLDSIKSGEESLLFDVFLAAAAMDTENHDRDGSPEGIEGPFYFPGAPELGAPFKLTQRPDEKGELLFFKGVVTSASGAPLRGAELDIWQADADGEYSKINPTLPEWNLRGRLSTDENGAFEVQSILPPPYEIPKNGPTGQVLELLGRHCFRPAHLHVKVRAEGHKELTSQLYFEGGDYLDSDVARAVRDNLIAKLIRYQGKNAVEHKGLERPFVELTYNFALEPA